MEIGTLSALELGRKIQGKEISAVEVTKAVLETIEATEGAYHHFIHICEKEALERSKEVEKKILAGELTSPLGGVPMAVKDNLCTKGIQTTCGSKMLQNFVPFYTATAVESLEKAGAILIGKTNMDEFAMGSTTETSFFGASRNPWNLNHVTGGSSGGSAGAVSGGGVFYALGSDTGGSVRQPAAYCGVTGLKPTYGRVSRYGLIAYASSLDQIGVLGKNVADVTAVYETIGGYDPKDSTSVPRAMLPAVLSENIKGTKIGIPIEFFGEGTDPEVRRCMNQAIAQYRELGAVIEEFSVPSIKYAVPCYYIIACAEASSNLARYDGIRYGNSAVQFEDLADFYVQSRTQGFGEEVKRRIQIGTFILSSGYYDAYYQKALAGRRILKKAYADAFEKYDVLLTPATPTTAPKIGDSLSDPLKMYLLDNCTVSVNLAGLTALVLPCGFDKKNLPIGLQLVGKPFGERKLLQVGNAYQNVTSYHKMQPNVRQERGK